MPIEAGPPRLSNRQHMPRNAFRRRNLMSNPLRKEDSEYLREPA